MRSNRHWLAIWIVLIGVSCASISMSVLADGVITRCEPPAQRLLASDLRSDPYTTIYSSDSTDVPPDLGSLFGRSVSIFGDTALIGARGNSDGAAYVFQKRGSSWLSAAKLSAPTNDPGNPAAHSKFGNAVAIWSDFALVGAPGEAPSPSPGAVYSFRKGQQGWIPGPALRPPSGTLPGFHFGENVALKGNTALIAAVDNNQGILGYLYQRGNGNQWGSPQILHSPGSPSSNLHLAGYSVALSDHTLLIGAWRESAAYFFRRRDDGSWDDQPQRVPPPVNGTGPPCDQVQTGFGPGTPQENQGSFGRSVAIDGDTALIGGYWYNNCRGAVYLFRKNTEGIWQIQEAGAIGQQPLNINDGFGTAVALEGNVAVIGAFQGNLSKKSWPNYGAGKVFIFNKTTQGWHLNRVIIGDSYGAGLGISVATAAGKVLMGAFRDNINAGSACLLAP